MPKLTLEIEVKDKASKEFTKLEKQLSKYGVKVKEATDHSKKMENGLASQAKTLAVYAAAIYAAAQSFDAIIGNGIRFNTMMEDQRNGIRALIVATSDSVDAFGNAIDINQRYAVANEEAVKTIKRLQDINAETPHTLGQTSRIFKSLFATSKAAGASMEDMVEVTKLISKASGAAGIEFQTLLASVDGLANGTFLANSDMGRFLVTMGLTPKALKAMAAEGKSIDFIKDKLKDFNFSTDSMGEATSNLANAWDQLTGEMTTKLFDDMKEASKDAAKFLEEHKEGIIAFGDFAISALTDVAKLLATVADGWAKIGSILADNSLIYQTFYAQQDEGNKVLAEQLAANTTLGFEVGKLASAFGASDEQARNLFNTITEFGKELENLNKDEIQIEVLAASRGFESDTALRNKFKRTQRMAARALEDAEKEPEFGSGLVDILETQVANSLTNAIQDGIDGDFDFDQFASSFADSIGSAFISSGITKMISEQMALGAVSSLGAVGIGVGLVAASGLFGGKSRSQQKTPEQLFAERIGNSLEDSAKALQDVVTILDLGSKAGTSTSSQITGIQRLKEDLLQSFRDVFAFDIFLAGGVKAEEIQSQTEASINRLGTIGGIFGNYSSELASLNQEIETTTLTLSNSVKSSLDTIGSLSDSLEGTTNYQDTLLANAKAQLPLTAQTEAGFKSYVGALSLQGIELNRLLNTVEVSTIGTSEYETALSSLFDILDLSDDATLEHALNVTESIELVGQSFTDVAESARSAADTIGSIIDSQQAFLDSNRALLETSGESVSRLQDRFTEEVNEANLAQILLSEARSSGSQAAIADAVANLNEQEQDILDLGQQVIDSATTAYGSAATAQDIIASVLGEVQTREAALLSVQESLQVEANEISLSILEQLEILNAKVVTTQDIFNPAVVA
jgi:hypothetical protein